MTVQTTNRFGAGAPGRGAGLTAQTTTRIGVSESGSGSNPRGNSRDGGRNPRGGDDGSNPRGSSRDGGRNPRGSNPKDNSRPGSRGSKPEQRNVTKKEGRATININYSMEGYEGENDRLVRQGNQGRLKIDLEKVNVKS